MKIIHYHFETIGSTNTWAKEHVDKFAMDSMSIVTAEEQTGGRGRFKRLWHSPKGLNIYTTFCFFVDLKRKDIGHIPQLLALSALQVIESLEFDFHPTLKWPNDVLLSGKKVAGILCETVVHEGMLCVFCGIGLNVNMPFYEVVKIDRPATSLSIESNLKHDKEKVFDIIKNKFLLNLEEFLEKGFTSFFEEYEEKSVYEKGDTIRFHNNQEVVEGVFECLNLDGSVTLKIKDKLQTYYAGEFLF